MGKHNQWELCYFLPTIARNFQGFAFANMLLHITNFPLKKIWIAFDKENNAGFLQNKYLQDYTVDWVLFPDFAPTLRRTFSQIIFSKFFSTKHNYFSESENRIHLFRFLPFSGDFCSISQMLKMHII